MGVRGSGECPRTPAGRSGSGREPRLPGRVRLYGEQPHTTAAPRRRRRGPQHPSEFREQAVGLARVARPTGGHAVLPGVPAASAARHHVVDGVRPLPAVGACLTVPAQHPGPGHGHRRAVGHPDVAGQPHHRRRGDGQALRTERVTLQRGLHQLGLAAEHQHHRAPRGHDRERLKCRIEQEHSGRHRAATPYRPPAPVRASNRDAAPRNETAPKGPGCRSGNVTTSSGLLAHSRPHSARERTCGACPECPGSGACRAAFRPARSLGGRG